MSTINFSAVNLKKLLKVNSYNYSLDKYTVFGIRGASPAGTGFDTFKDIQSIEKTDVNYTCSRCIIGIFNPMENKIALFPGSTVPNLKYIKENLAGTAKANCMMTGFYSYYEKGYHNPSKLTAHKALRLATNIVLRRSNNDLIYTNEDPIEIGNPSDNLHAAWCDDSSQTYSSAGCQVIVGKPKCIHRGVNSENTAFWKSFYDVVYNLDQKKFDYALFRYVDAEAVSGQENHPMQARLRFGSKGEYVKILQEKLALKEYFYTSQDGDFGRNTLLAVLHYQKDKFGIDEADGVVGNTTATSLGITLPMI